MSNTPAKIFSREWVRVVCQCVTAMQRIPRYETFVVNFSLVPSCISLVVINAEFGVDRKKTPLNQVATNVKGDPG